MIVVVVVFFGMSTIYLIQQSINASTDARRAAISAEQAAKDAKLTVAKQDLTLDAIKTLSLDNRITSKQLGNTIICMLQVPIAQRTTDLAEQCRMQAVDESGNPTNQTPPNGVAPSTQPNTPTTENGQTETKPAAQPNVIQRLLDKIKSIL